MIPIPFVWTRGSRFGDPGVSSSFVLLGGALVAVDALFFLSLAGYGVVPLLLGGAIVALGAAASRTRARRPALGVAIVLLAVLAFFLSFDLVGGIGAALAAFGGGLLMTAPSFSSSVGGGSDPTFRAEALGPPCPRCGRHIPTWTSQCPYCGDPSS